MTSPETGETIPLGQYVKLHLGGVRPKVVICGVALPLLPALGMGVMWFMLQGELPTLGATTNEVRAIVTKEVEKHAAKDGHAGVKAAVAKLEENLKEYMAKSEQRQKENSEKVDKLIGQNEVMVEWIKSKQ